MTKTKTDSKNSHKHQLYGKQEGKCKKCQKTIPFDEITVDHIMPKCKAQLHEDNQEVQGFFNSMGNKALYCRPCHNVIDKPLNGG